MISISVQMDIPHLMEACRNLKKNKGKDNLHTNILTQIGNRAFRDEDFAGSMDLELLFAFTGSPSIEMVDEHIRKMPQTLKNILGVYGVYQLAQKLNKKK